MRRVHLPAAVLLAALCAGPTSAQRPYDESPQRPRGEMYADPAHRFSVGIPSGWNAVPRGEGVIIMHGSAYAAISRMEGPREAQEIVAILHRQYGAQWRNFTSVSRGDFAIGGQRAAYEMFTGISPKGVPSLLRIAGVMAPDGAGYAVLGSAPQREFEDAQGALQSIDATMRFAGGAPSRGGFDPGQRPPDQTSSNDGQTAGRRSTAPTARGAMPGHYYRMRRVQLMDQYGFAQPVEAASLLVPYDWKFEGGVQWGPATGCTPNLVRIAARATSPDGASAIEFFTPYMWQWHDDPENRKTLQQMQQMQPGIRPCAVQRPTSATDYIRTALVPRYRAGARVVRVESEPQVAQAAQSMMQAQNASNVQAGLVNGMHADAGKVTLTYEVNGRPVDEWITGSVAVVARPAPSASAAMNGGSAMVRSYDITAANLTAVRAPAGELARGEKLYATIVSSVRPNIRWIVAAQQVMMNINGAGIQGATDRAAIWREAQGHISATIISQYEAQQGVQDRLAGQFSQTIRGRETFIDPSSRERVELSAGYRQAWSNGRGEYILSDDPNFDPAVSMHEPWVVLQRAAR